MIDWVMSLRIMPQGRTSPVTWRRPYALYTATWLDIVQQRLSQLLSTKHYWSHSQVGSDNRASFVSNTYVLTSHLMIHHGTSYRTGWHDTSRYILSHWLTWYITVHPIALADLQQYSAMHHIFEIHIPQPPLYKPINKIQNDFIRQCNLNESE